VRSRCRSCNSGKCESATIEIQSPFRIRAYEWRKFHSRWWRGHQRELAYCRSLLWEVDSSLSRFCKRNFCGPRVTTWIIRASGCIMRASELCELIIYNYDIIYRNARVMGARDRKRRKRGRYVSEVYVSEDERFFTVHGLIDGLLGPITSRSLLEFK